ncbi:MAG TPA: MarR family transcriptional regulator [Terriglobia bacterium]|nr:MarR family transcriptional regulator [Terriglobia bacterium]
MLSSNDSIETSDLIPLLVADVYQLAGSFRRLGGHIARRAGQTQARWQLLSVVSDDAKTVAQAARRLGLARQSLQRTADQLVRLGLAQYTENPDHVRSPLLQITDQGRKVLSVLTREAKKSHIRLSAGLKRAELMTVLRVVRQLCRALENTAVIT